MGCGLGAFNGHIILAVMTLDVVAISIPFPLVSSGAAHYAVIVRTAWCFCVPPIRVMILAGLIDPHQQLDLWRGAGVPCVKCII